MTILVNDRVGGVAIVGIEVGRRRVDGWWWGVVRLADGTERTMTTSAGGEAAVYRWVEGMVDAPVPSA